jgi:hypothetical protein
MSDVVFPTVNKLLVIRRAAVLPGGQRQCAGGYSYGTATTWAYVRIRRQHEDMHGAIFASGSRGPHGGLK